MFTIADLLVLGVALLLIAIFRYADRHNRSLEKLKRFSEKVQNEITKFSEEKAQHIRDLAIRMEVQHKSATQAIEQLEQATQALSERSDYVESIQKHIDQYDRALKQLVEMTNQVEKNITAIQQESEYIDSVGRRIKDSQKGLEQLHKEFTGIQERFRQENSAQLAEANKAIMQESSELAVRLKKDLDATYAESKGVIETLQSTMQDSIDSMNQTREQVQDSCAKIMSDSQSFLEESKQGLQQAKAELQKSIEEASSLSLQRLGDLFEESKQSIKELSESSRSDLEAKIDASAEQLQEQARGAFSALTNLSETSRKDIESIAESSQSAYSAIVQESQEKLRSEFQTMEESISDGLGNLEDSLTQSKTQLQEYSEATLKATEESLGNYNAEFVQIESKFRQNMNSIADKARSFETESIQMLQKELADKRGEIHSEFKEALASQKEKILLGLDEHQKTVQTKFDKLSEKLSDLVVDYELKLSEIEGKSQNFSDSLESSIQSRFADIQAEIMSEGSKVETRTLNEIDTRLSDYSENIQYRLSRLDSVTSSLDAMDEQLRQHSEALSHKVDSDITLIADSFRSKQQAQFDSVSQELKSLKAEVQQSENEILALRKESTESISAQLSGFEKEFFADLEKRKNTLDSALKEWTENFANSLREFKLKGEEERQELEGKYLEEFSLRIDQLRTALNSRIDELGVDVQGREVTIREALQILEERVSSERSALDSKLKNLQTQSTTMLENRCQEISDSIAVLQKRIEQEAGSWREKLSQQWQSESLSVEEGIGGFKTRMDANILGFEETIQKTLEGLRLHYKQESESIISQGESARKNLQGEIQTAQTQISNFSKELEEKRVEAIEGFNKDFQVFALEFSASRKEAGQEISEGMNRFRELARTSQSEFEELQKRLIANLHKDIKASNDSIREIERRQKDFLQQTKLFERADRLKQGLSEDIDRLKAEIHRFNSERKHLAEHKNDFLQIRSLGEEANEKLQRFSIEYRKLDNIEDKYKQIISLSETLDTRLNSINTKSDNVQRIQLTIQNLDKLQSELDQKHDRLSQRMEIFNATIEGVDRNFQQLTELDDRANKLNSSFANVTNEVDMLKGRLESLSAFKKESDMAMRNLKSMNELLESIEAKTKELQSAREWIARSETRMLEISDSADKKIEILGSLAGAGGQGRSGGQGGSGFTKPLSVSEKDIVIKLKQQGWKIDDIARTCKISRGEVELILEMAGK